MSVNTSPNELWRLYKEYRDSVFNKKYYGHRLKTRKQLSNGADIVVATAASSTLGGLILRLPGGTGWLTVVGGVAAVLTVLKPVLQLSPAIERYTRLSSGYGAVCFDLKQIVAEIDATHAYTAEHQATFQNTLKRLRDLAADDDPAPSSKLRQRYYQETNRECPPESFWMPKENDNA